MEKETMVATVPQAEIVDEQQLSRDVTDIEFQAESLVMFRLPSASTSAPMPGLRWRNGTTPIMSSTFTWAGGKEPDTSTSCVRSWKASWRGRPSG